MFVTIWEFHVAVGCEAEFARIYGKEGPWVAMFKRAEGFEGSELLRDDRRYLTIDRWRSRDAFDAFKKKFAPEYQALDRRCEGLTEKETHVGTFGAP